MERHAMAPLSVRCVRLPWLLPLLLLLLLAGCQSLPEGGGGRNSNYVEVFPDSGMPEFPDGGSR